MKRSVNAKSTKRKSKPQSLRDSSLGSAATKSAVMVGVGGAVLWICAAIFFYSQPSRWGVFNWLLLPDEIVSSWFQGDVTNFAILDRMLLGLAAMGIVFCAYGLGALVVDRPIRRIRLQDRLLQFAVTLGIGLSVLSLLTLSIGLAGGLHWPWLFRGIVILGWGRSAWQISKLFTLRGGTQSTEGTSASDSSASGAAPICGITKALLVTASLFFVFHVLTAMMPPWGFDAREYHLQVPKEWYLAGEIQFLPHNVYAQMPLGAEMPALFAMSTLGGSESWWFGAMVGKTILALYSGLGALAVFCLCRKYASALAGAIAAVVYISMPILARGLAFALIDSSVAAFSILAIACALGDSAKRDTVHRPRFDSGVLWRAAIVGLLAGSAFACKYPALLFVVLPVGVLLLITCGRNWQSAAVYSAAVLMASGLWFAKNYAQTGDPVYPLGYQVFEGTSRTSQKNDQWQDAHQVPTDNAGKRYSFVAAWDGLAKLSWRHELASPLTLGLGLLALFDRRRRKLVIKLYSILAFGFVVWFGLTHRIERFWVPMLPIAACLSGLGGAWLLEMITQACTDVRRARIITACVSTPCVLGLTYNCLLLGNNTVVDQRFFVPLETLRTDLPRSEEQIATRVHPAHRYLNDHVPDGFAALMVGNATPFDVEVPVYYNTCFDDCLFETWLRGKDRSLRMKALHDRKISHVFVDFSELKRYRSPGNYGYSEYVTVDRIRDEFVKEQGLFEIVQNTYSDDSGSGYFVLRLLDLPRLPQ